ncbi:uncharacterized protein LOC117129170 [Brassica rapa]|uniref:uncharacterized protein LOC117129170 n=1 Tax=Brassica campestris TaxID=3711 RepID=UPI00142D4602|nr:uncharacterized protein LOC117129170 [Brassica rapa]
MYLVIIVSGNWIKKNKYVFNADSRGCRVLHLDENSTHEAFAKSVLDDYGLNEMSDHIQLSYMFSNKALKAHDTPPVYVSNTRQLQGFVALKKIEQLRLCVEITENKDDRAREKTKTNFSFSSEVEASEVESRDDNYSGSYDGCSSEKEEEDNEIDCSSIVEGENQNVGGEDETGKENEEDDEFDSRFDMFDDSDGASSEDDNFSSYGDSPLEDEESPTIPPKKIYQNFSMIGSKESEEVLPRLDMSSLNLAVGQRYESKADLERRLKLLTVKDRFDYDVDISTRTLFIVKCWVDGCIWRVRASTKGESPAFYVCIYESNHTCSTTGRSNRCRNATPDILGELYKNFLGDVGPAIHPTSVGIAITKQFGVKVITLV